jgi:dTDP-D-glucose 4,6-dehydratase
MTTTTEVYEPHNVLITGGCGFIGSNFVNYIFDAWPNAQFINVDKLILNSDVNNVHRDVINSSRYRLVTSDIRNRQLMIDLLKEHQVRL